MRSVAERLRPGGPHGRDSRGRQRRLPQASQTKSWPTCLQAPPWTRSAWAQEAALLADRSDIAEELVRLRTHAAQLDVMLSGGGEVGKRLDFLLQEMNRESNTVLSKTAAWATSASP